MKRVSRGSVKWRGGAVRAHGWWPAEQQAFVARWPHWVQAELGTPEQADALVVMLNTARGLRRPTYAGPWVRATTPGGDTVLWLAYPWWEGEHFRGSYVLAVAVERALEQAIPAWFLADHRVQSVPEPQAADLAATHAWVSIPLSGAQWGLLVAPLGDQAAVAPRAFFGAALLCLLGMLVAPGLYCLVVGPTQPLIDATCGMVVMAGLLVGGGTRYGSGCTSGHGVCGIARMSPRSLAATACFMAAGIGTGYAVRHLFTV